MSARRFPSGSDYVEALQNPNLCFTDSELRSATVQVDKLGRPRPISGNFASVFSVGTPSGRRYAIKCFTRDVPDQEKRYRAVSEHLSKLPYDWKMLFDYQPAGIRVAGEQYPILRMEWVEAVSLLRWVEDHLGDQAALLGLAGRFAELTSDLHRAGIAHGDLQHGNLLVAADGSLKLVDYDGMFVPALSGLAATERGHRHYQPPSRTGGEFGPELDRFSVWLIYLSLVAVAVDPGLWHLLHEPDGEHLLLTDEDFVQMATSSRMASLTQHQVVDVRRLATYVADLTSRPLSSLPPLAPLQDISSAATAAAASQPAATPPASAPAGLPTWMTGHLPTPAPPPLVTFQNHRGALLMARLVLVGLTLAVALMAWFSGIPEVAAIAGPLLGSSVTRVLYVSRPETRSRKPIAAQHDAARRRVKKASRAAAGAEKDRDKLQDDDRKRAESHAKELQDLKEGHRQERGRYDRQTSEQLTPHDTAVQMLAARKSAELRRALDELQGRHIDAYLRRIDLRAGSISGIGAAIVGRLAVSGISTPADFVNISYMSHGYQNGAEVHLVLANGRSVHVPGVGEARAAALMVWREGHIQAAMRQANMPTALPAPQRQAIEGQFAAEERALKDKRAQIEQNRQNSRLDLVRRQTEAERRLIERHKAAVQVGAQALQDANQRLAASRAEHRTAVQEEQRLARELTAYREISYGRFLRTVLIGR
ncbi:hypothetical protein ACGFI3_40160 [Nonomuraea wenchangensis]|uniref:protein kinase domain-containing protein n=1 Tax=Nonomuraea wenchangensis TaxID=568860 RepID=UPI0037124136